MHTFFTLEDVYGLHISEIDGELCLRLDRSKVHTYLSMFEMFQLWQEEAAKFEAGKVTKEEYDQWRYTCPQMDAEKSKENLNALRAKKRAQTKDE